MILDWMMMVDRYSKLMEKARHQEEWHHWTFELAQGQRTQDTYLYVSDTIILSLCATAVCYLSCVLLQASQIYHM